MCHTASHRLIHKPGAHSFILVHYNKQTMVPGAGARCQVAANHFSLSLPEETCAMPCCCAKIPHSCTGHREVSLFIIIGPSLQRGAWHRKPRHTGTAHHGPAVAFQKLHCSANPNKSPGLSVPTGLPYTNQMGGIHRSLLLLVPP